MVFSLRAFDAIGIGGSAGSIGAIGIVLSALPSTFSAPIIVAVHHVREAGVGLAAIWAAQCRLRVVRAASGRRAVPGWVYVAGPDGDLVVDGDGTFASRHRETSRGGPSIDVLFASLASTYGSRAIGVVMSGRLEDGARGVRAMKARGGRVLVQAIGSAREPSMPAAAAATGCVDRMLPPLGLGAALAASVDASWVG